MEVKKKVFGPREFPSTKDGRRIPMGTLRGKGDLVDERTGHGYCSNTIRSSRYTLWNFFPKQLFYQFSKLANFYFLCVSILQMIPGLSTTGKFTTIVPLLIFIGIAMFKEGYDDYRRYLMDKSENNREAEIFDSGVDGQGWSWKTVIWHKIKVGDIIRLQRDDWVPADLLLLHSTSEGGIAYIETMALDGETNLKSKQTLPVISEGCEDEDKLARFTAEVICEDPNPDLYNFDGKVVVGGEIKPLTGNQVIYRGSVLRNTPELYGMVIFSGEESKIRMNANKNPRTKAPALQSLINRIVIMTVFLVLFLATFNTVAYQIWKKGTEADSWYLDDGSVPGFPIFASSFIMFNTLIPLSLYVSLEIVKVFQMYLFGDVDMYHEETDTPFEAHTSTINEDCGQISYIFSDKTGTLTDNSMLFRKMSVAGQAWLHDLDLVDRTDSAALLPKPEIKLTKSKKRASKEPKRSHSVHSPSSKGVKPGRKSMGDIDRARAPRQSMDRRMSSSSRWKSSVPNLPQPQLSTVDMLAYLRAHPHTFFARKARFFLLAMALCHTCLPEEDEETGELGFQAASPDEAALVKAAMELGYIVIDRDMDTITIKTFPNGPSSEPTSEIYKILEVIEFSSKRKRMSIVIRFPNGKICIFCKGADTTILELLRLRDLAVEKQREVERRASIRRSIEANEVIRRTSMQRQSMSNRPSIGGRPSIGNTRPSFGERRMSSYFSSHYLRPTMEDDRGDLLSPKKESMEVSSEEASLYSRPSGQYAARHSIAIGEQPGTPLERVDPTLDMVDEDMAQNDAKVFERCFAHINHFATEGLRTLLYAHRFMEEHEYQTWRKIYQEATTSLIDRQAMIERAAEIIERDFDLTGATAIEDRLQKGVPDAIEKLRRAGIKLWMLTGDKRETAINIGHSCRLIKDYSTVTVLDKDNASLNTTIRTAIADINNNAYAHSVVVVDGGTLSHIDADPVMANMFFDLAVLTDSVVCCRASPAQKASLVKRVRTKVQQSVTLAIGDGANDIAMIQEAHVGVGITGKEGLQAARVSDYSMAQFRFLLKFLLVHGRWNYVRTCKYVVSTFWKEMLFYLTQALYQRWNGYTGTSLYEPWTLSMFNTLFTSLPVIFIGIFDQDLHASTLLAVPELYGKKGPLNRGFNYRIYLGWMLLAVSQSMLLYFIPLQLYPSHLTADNGVFAFGVLTYSATVIIISTKLQVIEMQKKTIVPAVSFFVSIIGWWGWNLIFAARPDDNKIYNMHGGLTLRFGRDLRWWATLLAVITVCLLLDLTAIVTRVALWRNEVDVFREIEKRPELRSRLEKAAYSEEVEDAVEVDLDAMVGRKRGGWGGLPWRVVDRVLLAEEWVFRNVLRRK
ncbi:phospholipid-translocating P-type ATPase [Ascodesmis nigricans]|uniref:Phospholipid-transporting ATPase n=1 Tax=Ascodesmis nigricans TaxID=341454 RepID=A0A4S2MVH5_9PEZI|nr:phospholipid-translocating P-type ATPase [Ascodesmis nigricans]